MGKLRDAASYNINFHYQGFKICIAMLFFFFQNFGSFPKGFCIHYGFISKHKTI